MILANIRRPDSLSLIFHCHFQLRAAFLYVGVSTRAMILLAFYLLVSYFAFEALASHFPSTHLFSRDSSSPAINATVTDHSGLDVTSSFQIMVYHELENSTTTTNFTDRRRQPVSLSRPIIDCQIPNSVFVDSVCTYRDGKASG